MEITKKDIKTQNITIIICLYNDIRWNISGNIYLNLLTNQRRYRLKISLENFLNEKRYAEYGVFNVESHVDKYRLIIGNYSGNAGEFTLDYW